MRKAITPVISIILLILLVISITGGAWYWMTNFAKGYQNAADEKSNELLGKDWDLRITSLTCNSTNGDVNFTLINDGTDSFSSQSCYIKVKKSGNEKSSTTQSLSATSSGTSVGASALYTSMTAGEIYTITVEKVGGSELASKICTAEE